MFSRVRYLYSEHYSRNGAFLNKLLGVESGEEEIGEVTSVWNVICGPGFYWNTLRFSYILTISYLHLYHP